MGLTRRKASEALRRSRRRPRALGVTAGETAPSFFVAPVGEGEDAGALAVPDLLHLVARPWPDLRGSAALVRFGFEGGDCAGVFDALVRAMPLSPTAFVAESFASQLYLDDLIGSCFSFEVDGRRYHPDTPSLRAILQRPPLAEEDGEARRAALRDLTDHPILRRDLETLYGAVRKLRDALETGEGSEPSLIRRKIAVLTAIQTCVRALADGFETGSSVLLRLRQFGQELLASEGWKLLSSVVDLEGNVATVDVRLRLGSDGGIRAFEVLAVRENDGSPLLRHPVVRLLQRFASYLRGYRYGENEVVLRLLEEVFVPWSEAVVSIVALTGSLEFYLSALGLRDLAAKKGLGVCLPELQNAVGPRDAAGPTRILEGLFNPLLLLQGVTPRPVTLPETSADALVVITGPNSGGKTRLLQALALAQLLAEVGMFVPASRARLVRAPRLLLSLGGDDDARQVEGRLGTELLRVRRVFEQLEPGAVVILDELCSGTNPLEGEAIFVTVLELMGRLRPQVYVSTHFLGLAARLERERPIAGLSFLQVELDADEKPTFQFVPGVATSSLAHKVAERLGVTRDALEQLVAEKIRQAEA